MLKMHQNQGHLASPIVYAGPRSYKFILQSPVMGCPYAGILPQAQEPFY